MNILYTIKPSDPYRVLRGGSWFNDPAYARVAFRVRYAPDFRGNDLGFRLIINVEELR